ncbi:MAG TPA: acyl-CoA dehydrogenase family protein [Pseudomonadales bacterium]|jgi:acyl-CoA dehydrogenase|nr:acyl-CoA dehydrogenase family protein [Pseudomonadales bacterium]HMU89917.1 acyl-CoA dehydrogenase family protein [Pseudomonadales bacterium]HMW14344.1 acyl-CoA dehydrogenase family protein [Pseudomonadales bacterium]HMW83066.1 acyl-CoA dehydrogenase family protein [Pseudomonadales bacterium]HMY96518.1 acyl-CoA dehydrogenase family protein [Pseudomonadales bacterium]
MDFNDTPQEAAFRAEARAWLDQNAVLKDPKKSERYGMFSENESKEMVKQAQAWQAKKYDAGWACITWPKQYGGRGGTVMENIIFSQEERRYETPPNVFGIGLGMAGPTIMYHGTEEQKKRHLPTMARGDIIWCQLFSEPSAGSDLAALRTRSERQGDEWVINGQKVWTSGAHYSKWGILVTRSDFNAPKHKGLTYFVVDMESPGIEIRPIKQMTGGANFNEVFFTNVRIPDANRLDREGNGWAVAITTLMNERMSIGTGMGLTPDAAYTALTALAKNCYVNGKPAIENGLVRSKIGEFYSRLKALELTGYRVLSKLSSGAAPGTESAVLKLSGGILLQELSAFAMELQGPFGADHGAGAQFGGGLFQDIYLGIPAMRIAGGSDEVQRNVIAERELGLPQEARIDKNVPFKEIPTGSAGVR